MTEGPDSTNPRSHLVYVKHAEDERGELCRVAVREELLVDLDETLRETQTRVIQHQCQSFIRA